MSEVWLRAPPAHFFQFPPGAEPPTLPAPQLAPSFAQPFSIPPGLYNALLDVKVPITVASIYAVTVTLLNALNRSRGHKPWSFSKTRLFFVLVIAHNVFLAVYSAWTHIGMINMIRNIWPGWNGVESLPAVVDAFCKIQGPRGLGDAVSYDYEGSRWFVGNNAIKMLNGQPDNTDVGRMWNEGLAFYGWLFYLSKFYEVIDTLVILAKGKRSSFLQTYHHAGAMLCMWAGIRYMSPPIWMFCWINSGIHALMYTYYTLSALGIKVPATLKRSLTTMQITQFVVGFTYAIMHLFIAYKVPVQSPYVYFHNLSTALPSATSAVASAVATADIGSWLKKAMLRAGGDEGLSANVRNRNGHLFGHSGEQAVLAESNVLEKARQEIRYRTEFVGVSCIDTSGQSFAVLLNLLYLLPLTMLFMRFFVKSYLRRPASGGEARRFSKSGYDALKGVEKEVIKTARRDRGSAFTSPTHSDAEASSPTSPSFKENGLSMTKIQDTISEKAENLATKGVNGVKTAANKAKSTANDLQKQAKDSDLPAKADNAVKQAVDTAKETANTAQKKAENGAKDVASELKAASEDKLGKGEVEAPKTPSKKKKNKNKNKNKDTTQTGAGEPHSYAEAAAAPPSQDAEDVIATEGQHTTVIDTDEDTTEVEASIDELTSASEKAAEKEMQPDNLS